MKGFLKVEMVAELLLCRLCNPHPHPETWMQCSYLCCKCNLFYFGKFWWSPKRDFRKMCPMPITIYWSDLATSLHVSALVTVIVFATFWVCVCVCVLFSYYFLLVFLGVGWGEVAQRATSPHPAHPSVFVWRLLLVFCFLVCSLWFVFRWWGRELFCLYSCFLVCCFCFCLLVFSWKWPLPPGKWTFWREHQKQNLFLASSFVAMLLFVLYFWCCCWCSLLLFGGRELMLCVDVVVFFIVFSLCFGCCYWWFDCLSCLFFSWNEHIIWVLLFLSFLLYVVALVFIFCRCSCFCCLRTVYFSCVGSKVSKIFCLLMWLLSWSWSSSATLLLRGQKWDAASCF